MKTYHTQPSKREGRSLAAIAIMVGSLLAPHGAQAAAGRLDASFGNGGVAITDFAQTDDYASAVEVQPDGTIIVAGSSGIYPDFHSALVRYTRNGGLDSAFGNGGKVVAQFDSNGDDLSAIVLQSDGKIVAAGSIHGTAFLVARFNADGSLDQAFGSNGSVETKFGDPSAGAADVVLQTDGKIIAVGVSGAGSLSELNDFALARYNSDGSLDQTFGSGGKVITHFPGVFNTGSTATSAMFQSDGKLVVGGFYKNEGTPHQFALARYNSNGSLDFNFGRAGKVMTPVGTGDAFSFAIALQSNGRIVLAGYSDTTQGHDFSLAGYASNGTLDTTFGNGGIMATDFAGGSDDIAYAMTMQRDGKLVVAGRTGPYPEFDFAGARYSSDGQLDQNFGTGGKVTTSFSSSDDAYAVAFQPNGKIILAGISFANGANFDFAVARYLGR
ncbi:MAG: hypothetical protein H0X34_08965 [Chthoniobacterales bacterium]|nr:hypothetical protein [Chthoniobacterales bacterium]